MKNQRLRKGLSGVLATLMLLQAMPMGASAWSIRDWFGSRDEEEETAQVEVLESREAQEIQLQDGTAVIPSTATDSEVKEILCKTLISNYEDVDTSELAWEYYCTGKNGLLTNDAWGSVNGFTSKKKIVFVETEFTHPALAANSDDEYQVRLKGNTDNVVTLNKVAKLQSSITLNEGCTVALPYNENASVDYNALREDIWDEVVADTTPDLDWNSAGVSIEYRYNGEDFGNLEGDDGSILGLGSYDPISSGPQVIRISWDGNDRYYDCEETVAVNFTDRTAGSIVLKEDQEVALPYISADEVDYEALKEAIFETVVESITPSNLTAGDVTIEYYAENYLGSEDISGGTHEWAPLEGGTIKNALGIPLTYPAISASETSQQIRISWDGNGSYSGFQEETTVTIAERADVIWEHNDNVTVGLAYTADLNIDYEAMEQAIYNSVVISNTYGLDFDDVTIEYNADPTGLTDSFKPLNWTGETGWFSFGVGTWTIRFSWNGTQAYQAGSFTATVTVEERPTAPYTLKDPIGSVTITVDENLETDFDALHDAIFSAVVASSDILTADNVTITYYAEAVTGSMGDLGWSWVSLEGGTVNALKYPAISAGEQKIRISWPGDQTYAPTTIEKTVTVNDREQLRFTLKNGEGPYEVGMKFTADQGYDYAATAQAIYEAVVESTTPEVDFSNVTLEFSKNGISYKPLDQTNFFASFGVGEWKIKISVADTQTYRGNSTVVTVTTTDNRKVSAVALKPDVSFTYNMDPAVMEQAIFDNVIDWDNSTLPARETLSPDNFTMEYYGTAVLFDGGIDSDIQNWVPVEGKSYDLGELNLGTYPQLGAGENQQIRVSFNGNADYRPSETAEGAVTVNKATVKVKVHSDNIYADEALPEGFITTDPADVFDQYVIYAGITSNVTTALYLDLPDRYDDNAFLKILDPVVEVITGKSFTQMLNDGVTVGELRELLSTQELLDLLDKLNIDTGTFGQILEAVNKMPGILDSVRISFGAPSRAGLYTVAVVTDNQNYETGFGMGFLLVKMRLSGVNLTWNQEIQNGKLTAEEAKTFDFGATLSYDGNTTISQESVSYLYSGFTSKWRVYSSTTTPPTEPGRYVMTVVTLGGNYQAAPITRSFQITK